MLVHGVGTFRSCTVSQERLPLPFRAWRSLRGGGERALGRVGQVLTGWLGGCGSAHVHLPRFREHPSLAPTNLTAELLRRSQS